MREQPINQAVRSSRRCGQRCGQRCGLLELFLAVTASFILFSPDEIQAQSQKGYWIKFTPDMSPLLQRRNLFTRHQATA